MSGELEIERKYLLHDLPPDLDTSNGKDIQQGYLCLEDGRHVRVRTKGSKFFLTVKVGEGIVRTEYEAEISKEQFDVFWPATEGRRLEKVRHIYPLEQYEMEIDVYAGDLAPLVVAEVEFPSISASDEFVPPAFVSEEVSGNPLFSNIRLALEGLKNFAK
ncbi:MAG: hypothetical protein JKY01_05750 [Pseudomonadales bacterium]|nr:hypothetical protein [Pseudomonadales bacterium]